MPPAASKQVLCQSDRSNGASPESDCTLDVATLLLDAGESLASPLRERDRLQDRARHADPSGLDTTSSVNQTWLVDVARHAAALMAEDPARMRLAEAVCAELADGLPLRRLFGSFLPEHPRRRALLPNGRQVLTDRHVDVLEQSMVGGTHAEIAARLGVSARTVSTHLTEIYRRLGVNRTSQALARAAALGYVALSPPNLMSGGDGPVAVTSVERILGLVSEPSVTPQAESLRRLARFGLMLAVTSAAGTVALQTDATAASPVVGAVCGLDGRGGVRNAFGGEVLRRPVALAVAPQHAERCGFRAGSIFVVNEGLPQHRLNTAELVEFGPEGQVLQRFCGGAEAHTRLADVRSAAFSPDGALMVAAGGGSDSVLAFTDGGRRVACRSTMSVAQLGCSGLSVIAVGHDDLGWAVAHLPADGAPEYLWRAAEGVVYAGVAAAGDGTIFVCRVRHGRAAIEFYGTAGQPRRMLAFAGLDACQLACDSAGRLVIPGEHACDVRRFDADGRLEQSWDLTGLLSPRCIACGPDDSVWVAGQAE